jgi:hypothetical protein
MMAQRIECHCDHEIVIASALPKLIPVDAAASALLMPQRIRQPEAFPLDGRGWGQPMDGNALARTSVLCNAFQ